MTLHIHPDTDATLRALAKHIVIATQDARHRQAPLHVAIPGGETPNRLFALLAEPAWQERIPWDSLHLHWGDERCVAMDDPQSNYGATRRLLLDRIPLAADHIHRIHGESANPLMEAERHARQLAALLPAGPEGLPCLDWIILGLGTDGHTASLFAGDHAERWSETARFCLVCHHPVTGQARISLNLPLINAAKRVTFLVTGSAKAPTVAAILDPSAPKSPWPAGQVQPQSGRLEWFLDRDAAALLPDGVYLDQPA
ncbi:MAG: 6-phosphogluconolactonase [Magnetococcales bacterium]|nr:6-phosphogluconolactonase [Magnetococcales bacterium]